MNTYVGLFLLFLGIFIIIASIIWGIYTYHMDKVNGTIYQGWSIMLIILGLIIIIFAFGVGNFANNNPQNKKYDYFGLSHNTFWLIIGYLFIILGIITLLVSIYSLTRKSTVELKIEDDGLSFYMIIATILLVLIGLLIILYNKKVFLTYSQDNYPYEESLILE